MAEEDTPNGIRHRKLQDTFRWLEEMSGRISQKMGAWGSKQKRDVPDWKHRDVTKK